jgi:hypothetical protein
MKLLTINLVIIVLSNFLISCYILNRDEAKADIIFGDELTPEELNFVPYQVNDEINFKNKNGDVLTFKCVRREHFRDPYNPNATCGANVEFCTMIVNDNFEVELKCITDPKFNIKFKFIGGRFNDIEFTNLNYNSISLPIDFSYPCDIKSTVYGNGIKYNCLSTYQIGAESFNDVSEISRDFSGYEPYYLDTLYYQKDNGIIKLSFGNEAWLIQ